MCFNNIVAVNNVVFVTNGNFSINSLTGKLMMKIHKSDKYKFFLDSKIKEPLVAKKKPTVISSDKASEPQSKNESVSIITSVLNYMRTLVSTKN